MYHYDGNTVLKSISLLHANDNVAKALDRIYLFNKLFPNTAMSVVDFGRDRLGQFRIIALQRYIQGCELTLEELEDFRRKQQIADGSWHIIPSGIARITDLSSMNVLKDDEGNYFVIDCDIDYLIPAYGGSVKFDNSLSKIST